MLVCISLTYKRKVVLKSSIRNKILLEEGKIVNFEFALLQGNRNFNASVISGQDRLW